MNLFDDMDDCPFIWNYLYNNVIECHLPSRKTKIRSKSLLWIDFSITKGMNKRFKLVNRAKASRDPVTWSQYRKKGNEVKNPLKKAKVAYWNDQFNKSTNP